VVRPLENLQQGSIVSVLFPFSDASATKRRPAFLIAHIINHRPSFNHSHHSSDILIQPRLGFAYATRSTINNES
jgi:hypothetical protein